MNRKHPGTPPSKRRNWPGDWRDRLRTTSRSLATKLRDTFEYDDPTVRRHIIKAVRMAIGEGMPPDDDLVPEDVSEDGTEIIEATTAKVYRMILEGDGFDREDPVMVESFMAEVVAALDIEVPDVTPMIWQARVEKSTDMLVALTRGMGTTDLSQLRDKVIGDAREALGPKPGREMMSEKLIDHGDGAGPVSTPLMSSAGIFRLAFNESPLDRSSDSDCESFMVIVERRLDEVLASPELLRRICGGKVA
jgi:hypothetical protein